jgi:hypothetical protein
VRLAGCVKLISLLVGLCLSLPFAKAETVTFKVRELGTVRASLTMKKDFGSVAPGSEFFQGSVKFTSHTLPLAALREGEKLTLTFPGKVTGSSGRGPRLYRVTLSQSNGVRVSRVPLSALPENQCAEADHSKLGHEHTVTIKESPIRATEAVRVVPFRAYTDPEWQARYGSSSTVEVLNAVNVAESIYNRQLGIRFRVLSVTHLSGSFQSSKAGELLSQFSQSPEAQNSAAVSSLFTGKDMDGSTAGIAYVGVVCYSPRYSYNVVQSYGSLTGGIFAHEVGHNFGATHDTSNSQSLMYPFISYSNTGFSQRSLGEITSHLSYFNDCLTTESLAPLLSGSSLTIKKIKKAVRITLVSVSGTPIDSTRVVYSLNGKVRSKETSLDGSITVPVRVKGKVVVKAKVQADPTLSSRVVLRF